MDVWLEANVYVILYINSQSKCETEVLAALPQENVRELFKRRHCWMVLANLSNLVSCIAVLVYVYIHMCAHVHVCLSIHVHEHHMWAYVWKSEKKLVTSLETPSPSFEIWVLIFQELTNQARVIWAATECFHLLSTRVTGIYWHACLFHIGSENCTFVLTFAKKVFTGQPIP